MQTRAGALSGLRPLRRVSRIRLINERTTKTPIFRPLRVRPSTALLYAHPHPAAARKAPPPPPCIERTRDAHGRSNVPRPLQSRFEARKKPEGYTSTQTGLKRLRTQITAFRGNENRKGRHQAPPTYTQAQTHSCKRRFRRFLFWWSVAYTVLAVVGVTAPLRPRRRHRPPASPRAPSRTWTGRRTGRGGRTRLPGPTPRWRR